MASANKHITNINKTLKNVKSKVMVNFIHLENLRITIISNSVTLQSNLQVMERYIKNMENIRSDNIQVPRLPQSKSYLKIIGIPYFVEDTNTSITSDSIKATIKANHIFNDLSLIAKPRVVKVFSRSNMAVIWINIWDTQSSKNDKMLINRCFNVGRYIATI